MIRGLGRGAGGAGGDAGAGAGAGLHLAVQRRREGLDVGTRVQTLILRNSEQEDGHRSNQITATIIRRQKWQERPRSGGAPRRPRVAS